eukprot:452140-Rhodomonas_salina.3
MQVTGGVLPWATNTLLQLDGVCNNEILSWTIQQKVHAVLGDPGRVGCDEALHNSILADQTRWADLAAEYTSAPDIADQSGRTIEDIA